ncbi:VOC family protein [Nocardiopsis sp. RSe5-2]|uniref:VOC family protein n=1 Tax=Nocardiopsis endophytica TaxID=3018445 RepID=A0ABT4U6W2_9ACTN|nr:VOC family protein [Nocardiopsis endophytica]MDA2812685.1 VOC family protein [Nocardiopsis endophytica]
MAIELNHTIVLSSDKERSSRFLTELFDLPPAKPFGPFMAVEAANAVTLDYMDTAEAIVPQHYAFLVGEDDFDRIFGRIRDRGMEYWADPGKSRPGEINRNDGGRGVYFDDPDGHRLEIITRPYGSGG